jgi:proteasome lid subunit RPN8/RPN11
VRVDCPLSSVETTVGHLKRAGDRRVECVVLWLARREGNSLRVEEAYLPTQSAREDHFHIPAASMNVLYGELRRRRLMVAAQVHSHPEKAFHSKADDEWAIIRHEGALSLVVPYFASETTAETFLEHSKVFQFSADARWREVPRAEVSPSWLQIT